MSEGAAVLRPAALCAAVAQLSHTGLDSPPAVASTQSAVWFSDAFASGPLAAARCTAAQQVHAPF